PAAVEALMNAYGLSAEEAEFQLGFQGFVIDLRESLASRFPDEFGGLWVNRNPFAILVAFTNDADVRVEELQSQFTEGEYLTPLEVDHSLVVLDEVVDLLTNGKQGTGELAALEGRVFDVRRQLTINRVVVVTEDPLVASTIASELPPNIVVIEGGPTTTTSLLH
ncbi:MAG: hypothetical protein KJN73_07210, partial [Acidimicrobiia bacterium]|nr:hypothetical protein [Acidimicrobiia bacterium]